MRSPSGRNPTPPSGHSSTSMSSPNSGAVASSCARAPNWRSARRSSPRGRFPAPHPLGACPPRSSRTAARGAGAGHDDAGRTVSGARNRRPCRTRWLRRRTARPRNVRPDTPIHDASSASGPLTCEMPIRPQGKPPYGQEPTTCSRSVHSPATSNGSSMRRAAAEGRTRGIHRYASAIGIAPAAVSSASSIDNATQGTGPRYRAVKSRLTKKNAAPKAKPTRSAENTPRPTSAMSARMTAGTAMGHQLSAGKAVVSRTPPAKDAATAAHSGRSGRGSAARGTSEA